MTLCGLKTAMGAPKMLDFASFLQVVRNAPLVSIDLIVQNEAGAYLLGKRLNEPAKGDWFVPGGRIRKNETLDQAFERITQAELGISLKRNTAQLQGVYEHFYETNAGEQAGFGTHYVVLGYHLKVQTADLHLPEQEQHLNWRWLRAEEILQDPQVNGFTKDYFTTNQH